MDMNYKEGCHVYNSNPKEAKIYDRHNIFLLHFEKCFGVEYSIKRKQLIGKRVPKQNIENGLSVHYMYSEERMREDYINLLNSTFDINEIIDKAV
jgi:hypothetical protein